jgi:hypothetical protein
VRFTWENSNLGSLMVAVLGNGKTGTCMKESTSMVSSRDKDFL